MGTYFLLSGLTTLMGYLFYVTALSRETFFSLNRLYLLGALILSILVPLVDLSELFPSRALSIIVNLDDIGLGASTITATGRSWLSYIYWIGTGLQMGLLLIKLFKVRKRIDKTNQGDAYSFWKTKVIDPARKGFQVIDAHESLHIRQRHTLDILFMEMMVVFFWFNPLIYLYRRSLSLVHEYLADEHAAAVAGSKKHYAMLLFAENFNAGPQLAHSFGKSSQLECRISMLQRKRSGSSRRWKYLACLPILLFIISLSAFSPTISDEDNRQPSRPASFPGGFEAFKIYLIQNARKVPGQKGRVKVSFMIENNGELSDVKIAEGLDAASNQEALRLLESSPKWQSATQNGKKVRSAYQMGINF